MPDAIFPNTRSRRAVFAGAGALLAGAALSAAPTLPAALSPDAELIALCAQFESAQKQIAALYEGPAATDEDGNTEALRTIYTEQIDPILGRIDIQRIQIMLDAS